PADARDPDVALHLGDLRRFFAHSRAHVLPAHRLSTDAEVRNDLRAHGLADVEFDGQPAPLRRGARELSVLDVRRPDAEDDSSSLKTAEGGPALQYAGVHLQRMVRAREVRHEAAVRALQVDADEVHG